MAKFPAPSNSEVRPPITEAALGALEKTAISYPYRESKTEFSVVHSVTQENKSLLTTSMKVFTMWNKTPKYVYLRRQGSNSSKTK
jgi:hypothetical protein